MPDFEDRIHVWRRGLLASGVLMEWQADELEDHLRTALAAAMTEEQSALRAWRLALERTGEFELITAEFKKEQPMNPMSRLLGIALVITVLGLLLGHGPGGLGLFLHLTSLICFLALVFGGLVASFGLKRVGQAFRASMLGSTPLEIDEVSRFVEVFRTGQRLAWTSGVLLAIIGLLQMMANLSDPGMIGRGIATATLSLFYGALLAEFGFAYARQWLENRSCFSAVKSGD